MCKKCPKGFASDKTEASTCKSCADGKYTGVEGLSSCTPCGTGTSADSPSASTCQACIAGKYQENNPSLVYGCKVCPGGYYAASTSSEECQTCNAGKYVEDDNNAVTHNSISDCKDCAVLSFNPFEGQSFCRQCKTNTDNIGQKEWYVFIFVLALIFLFNHKF